MASPNIKRFTQFDAMEARGDFVVNSANANSPDYNGPQAFPRMVYAPEEEILVSGTYEEVKGKGVMLLGEQKALRNRLVNSRTELADALADGWFDHPAKALGALIERNRANGLEDNRAVPPITAQETIDSYERRIAELQAKLDESQKAPLDAATPSPPARRGRTSQLDP